MRAPLVLAPVLVAAVLVGCGGPSPDLFAVNRTGRLPGAKLELVVGDGGQVRCNGGALLDFPSDMLIDAREIARELNGESEEDPGPARDGLVLESGAFSNLRYRVRTEFGSVGFGDTSKDQPEVFYRVAKLTRDLAKKVCGLAR